MRDTATDVAPGLVPMLEQLEQQKRGIDRQEMALANILNLARTLGKTGFAPKVDVAGQTVVIYVDIDGADSEPPLRPAPRRPDPAPQRPLVAAINPDGVFTMPLAPPPKRNSEPAPAPRRHSLAELCMIIIIAAAFVAAGAVVLLLAM